MRFADLVAGSSLFLDTNALVYYFQPHPVHGPACQQLVQRVEQGQLLGFVSTHVLGEMAHRLMTLEASSWQGWSSGKVGQRLRKQPAAFQKLSHFQTAVDNILQSRIQVVAIPPSLLRTASSLSRHIGLLFNDALIIAVMQDLRLTNLASNDPDFDRVPGITRYAPA